MKAEVGSTVYVVDGYSDKSGPITKVFASRSKAEKRVEGLKKRWPGILVGVLERKVQ